MPEKSSNKASIIIALVAIFLILGGVYLLNQAISKPKTDTVAKASSSSLSSQKSSSAVSTSQAASQSSVASSVATTTSSAASQASTSTGSSTSTTLKTNEMIVTNITSDKAGLIKMQINECAQPASQYCKVNTKFYLNLTKDESGKIITIGTKYKVYAEFQGSPSDYTITKAIVYPL
jgi:cytoskeletal protein RodZ